MIALVLATLLAQPAAAPEPFPFTPDAEKLADTGYDLLTKGKAAEALVPLRELTRIAPDNPRACRLLGIALEENGDHDSAEKELTRAIELKVDAKRLPSTHAMRARARHAKNDPYGARFDIDTAIALEPRDPDAHAFSALLYLRMQQWSKAESAARKAVELAADSGVAYALLATALAEQGEHAASRAGAAKARALAFPNTEWLDDIDKMNTRELRKALLWQIPLVCLAVMGAVLLLLYLAGTALSGAQFGSLAALHPHMLRGEQTPRERFVLRLYLGVLWFGTIFFYVSVPAMVVLSLAVGVGLAYLMVTNLSHIPLKIVAIVVIGGLGGVWAVLRGLFLPASAETSGKEITSSDEPGLFAALGEVAEVAGTRRVDRVYLELGAEAAVRESGGAWRVLLGRGERVLHLGFWALHGLTITELKAILAHEYGHFSHGETRLTPIVSRIINTVLAMFQRMVALGASTYVNPVYWYLRLYFYVFLIASSGHSRRRELLADRAAALGYGGDAFGMALRKVIDNDAYFGQKAGTIAVLLRLRGNPCTAIYRALQAGNALVPAKLREGRLRELLESKPEEFDSHPPPNDRIARVAGVPGSRAAEDGLAISLLRDPEATSQVLATILQSRIDARLAAENKMAEDVPMDPGAQVLFAEGLQLHDGALGLQELEDPEADGMLAAAVERLQAALGPKDPILTGPLKNLARTQQRLGRKAEAEATLSRALDILAEHPDEEEERNVRGMMTELAAA